MNWLFLLPFSVSQNPGSLLPDVSVNEATGQDLVSLRGRVSQAQISQSVEDANLSFQRYVDVTHGGHVSPHCSGAAYQNSTWSDSLIFVSMHHKEHIFAKFAARNIAFFSDTWPGGWWDLLPGMVSPRHQIVLDKTLLDPLLMKQTAKWEYGHFPFYGRPPL